MHFFQVCDITFDDTDLKALKSFVYNLIFSVLSKLSFPRFLNGFGSFLNVTVRDEVFNFTSNMSEYLNISQGK